MICQIMLREAKCSRLGGCVQMRRVGDSSQGCIHRNRLIQRSCQQKAAPAMSRGPCNVSRRSAIHSIMCKGSSSPASTSTPRNSKLKRSIWTAVDVFALLGSVGGALAALLGVVSPTYALTLPLVLPVVSLIAALQREDLTNEEGRQYLSELSSSLGRDSAALLREAAAAIEEVRREAKGQSATAARLAALEDKLAVLEGAVVGAARNSREAAVGVNALGSALQQNFAALGASHQASGAVLPPQTAQLLAGLISSEVVPLVRAELSGVLGPWLAESHAALRRLDTRLAVVEGSLAGLEQAQTDSLMRLSSSLSSSLTDAQAALQSSVRVEVAAAVEPLKQLPQMVTAAAGRAQQQQIQLVPQDAEQQPLIATSGVDTSLMLPELRELVAVEVAAATQQLLNQQSDILVSLSQSPRPTPLAEDQWEALGRRLARLERLVQSLPELGEQAVATQLGPVLTAQQAAAEAQQNASAEVTTSLADVTQSLQRLEAIVQGSSSTAQNSAVGDSSFGVMAQDLGRVQQQLDQLCNQVEAVRQVATSEDRYSLDQAVQQLLQLLQQQGQLGQGPVAAGAAAADISQVMELLYALQQQVQGLAAALQQVQMDIPAQVGLAVSQAGTVAGGNGYSENGSETAAVQGMAEVQRMLRGVHQVCEGLQLQVGALADAFAAQQAVSSSQDVQLLASDVADNSAVLAVAEQQLVTTAANITGEISQQMKHLCESLQQQLLELQQQLASTAAAAAFEAASEAAAAAVATQAGVAESETASPPPFSSPQDQQQPVNGSEGLYNRAQPYQQQSLTHDQSAAAAAYPNYQQQSTPAAEAEIPTTDGTSAGAGLQGASWPAYGVPQDVTWPASQAATQQQSGSAPAPAVPPSLQPQQPSGMSGIATIPDPALLTDEQLRSEGLRLLRSGREATRGTGSYAAAGPDFAAAEAQLQAAVACFSKAVESEPQDTRALGNLGNALLAQGELKKGLLDELLLNAVQGGLGPEAVQSLRVAELRLRSEASTLLTRAGEIFRRVLEVDGWSSRALVNWGKAMVGRAELSADTAAAIKLYNAAIDKFEAVLEEDPGMVVAKYRCALAMQGLAGLNPDSVKAAVSAAAGAEAQGSRQQLVLLSDAFNYLSDVVKTGAGGDEGLREAAAAALRQVQQQLELAKLARK